MENLKNEKNIPTDYKKIDYIYTSDSEGEDITFKETEKHSKHSFINNY